MLENILLASPRGYCAGVERAIQTVERALETYAPRKIYVRHAIVHNEQVIADLEAKGVIFVEELDDITDPSAVVVLSAHGSPENVIREAKERFTTINATCPLVTKVHFEAMRYAKQGYTLVLIGHKGHQEVKGTMGHAPMYLVETVQDVEDLDIGDVEKIIYLTQTTLSIDETRNIILALKKKYPQIIAPCKEDICYATTNRQKVVREMVYKGVSLVLVVGSKTSSNSLQLMRTAQGLGVNSYLIGGSADICDEWFEDVSQVGITSGASVPECLVQEVVSYIREKHPRAIQSSFSVVDEKMVFPLPKEVS